MSLSLAPLRVAGFARLAIAYTLNEFGDWFGAVALALLVFAKTGSPLAMGALFTAAKLIPAFLAPMLTARLDELPAARALPALYLAEALIFAGLAASSVRFALAVVVVLALVDGTLALSARALARAAIAARLDPRGMLREGNALVNLGFATAAAAGPALAGGLVAGLGISTVLLLDAATFLAIAALLARTPGLAGSGGEREPWLARARAGLVYVWRQRRLRLLLAGQAVLLVFFTAVVPIEVIYAKRSLGTDSQGFGLLLSAWGLGIVAGSLVFARARQRTISLVFLSTALVGLAYVGLGAAGSLLMACLISVGGGCGNGIQWVAVVTAVQEATESEMQARVVGLLESVGAAMPGLGFVLGALVTAAFTPRVAYLAAGGGILALLLVAAVATMRGRALGGVTAESAGTEPQAARQ